MVQKAFVLKTFPDDTAELSVQRKSACGGNCSGCEGCSSRDSVIRVTAENRVGASSGQTVLVETKTRVIFKFAVLVYIMPIIFLIIGYTAAFILSLSEAMCILTGFCSLLAGTAVVLLFQRKRNTDTVTYSITSVLEEQQ